MDELLLQQLQIQTQKTKRTKLVNEFLESEKLYLQSLDILSNSFGQPLRSQTKFVSPEQHRIVFSNVEVIHNVTKVFCDQLELQLSTWDAEVTPISESFLYLAKFIKIYGSYVVNYTEGSLALVRLQESKQFVDFLKKAYKSGCSYSLEDLLMMPVNRIEEYPKLIQEIAKQTWKDHPDFDALNKASTELQANLQFVTEQRANIQEAQKVTTIITKLSKMSNKDNLLSPTRRLVKEGAVTYKEGAKIQIFYIFLFNDLLLWSFPKKKEFVFYKLHYLLDMKISSSFEGAKSVVQLSVNENISFFYATSEEETAAWAKAIKAAYNAMQNKEKEGTNVNKRTTFAFSSSPVEETTYTGRARAATLGPDSLLPVLGDNGLQRKLSVKNLKDVFKMDLLKDKDKSKHLTLDISGPAPNPENDRKVLMRSQSDRNIAKAPPNEAPPLTPNQTPPPIPATSKPTLQPRPK